MGKKKAFDKKAGQKFSLLHRSHTDGAYEREGVPSELVLVPVKDGKLSSDEPFFPSRSKPKDHINEFGFPNDGYDYSKHLKEMGQGKFIAKDGKVRDNIMFNIPADLLPSEEELPRDYEAITISHELMDEDIRAALFDGFDAEGEFEEIDDDFVNQVMQEPDVPNFDFDEHIAKLIARSESLLGINKPRGWDEEDMPIRELSHDSEDDESFATPVLTELQDDTLDRILKEYDSEDDEDEEVEGVIDEDNPIIQSAIEEYLQNHQLPSGVLENKRLRASELVVERDEERILSIKESNEEQLLLQLEAEERIKELEEESEKLDLSLIGQEYLQNKNTEEVFDCESVVAFSTCTENRPKLVKASLEKFQPFHSLKKKTNNPRHRSDDSSLSRDISNLMIDSKLSKRDKVIQEPATIHEVDECSDDSSESSRSSRGVAARPKETKEEKRLRKAAVKNEKRQRRMKKKLLKEAFRKESEKISQTIVGSEQTIDHVSVFRYTK